jgi:hypothetical protein
MAIMLKTLIGDDIPVKHGRHGLDEVLAVEHIEDRQAISTRAKKLHTP